MHWKCDYNLEELLMNIMTLCVVYILFTLMVKFGVDCFVPAGWFDIDREHNHNVYVSGLPLDVTMEEFLQLMGKCGIVMENEDGALVCVACCVAFVYISISLFGILYSNVSECIVQIQSHYYRGPCFNDLVLMQVRQRPSCIKMLMDE